MIYNRQEKLNLNTDLNVYVLGAGGIGYWVVKFLAMSGVEKIRVFDFDTIEASNLNRLDVSADTIGKNKVDVLKEEVEKIRPDCLISSFPFKFEPIYMSGQIDVIIDCTDDEESMLKHELLATDRGIKYIKAGYDGTHVTVATKIAKWGKSNGGYTIVPSWVCPAVLSAALAVATALKNIPHANVSIDMLDFFK